MEQNKVQLDDKKYYRTKPIKEFDLFQTMYSLVTSESKGYENLNAISFMGNNMTYKELIKTSDMLAASFKNAGVKEGDNVSILTINIPIVQQCLLSLSKIGATMSWIDLRSKDKDLIKYINNGNCKVLVVFEDMLPMIESIINETNVEKVIIASPKYYLSPIIRTVANLKDKHDGKKIIIPNDKRFIKLNDFIKDSHGYENLSAASFDKEKPSLIVQSSGSTGKPKQIVHTEYNFNSAVQKMAYTDLPFYRGNSLHVSIPPFIIYGLGNSIYGSMAFTMKAEMNPFVNEDTIYNDLGKFDISLGAPLHYRYIYNRILELNEEIEQLEKDNSLSAQKELAKNLKEVKRIFEGIKRVKAFVSGGDKIGAEELIRMEHIFDTPIINGYGNNECLGATIVSPLYANKPGSIGIPMKGVDIKIVNPETGVSLNQGEIGELYISSDNLFKEYLGNEEETKKIKEIDKFGKEWVKSGDLCYIDQDGYVVSKGRSRRLIRKEAFKISPDTIEEVIKSNDYVKDCVVVGVDDEKSISVPMAFIVLKDGINLDDVIGIIKEQCFSELPDYEVPTYFEQIDKIPYTPNDKQDFRKLEELGNNIVLNKSSKKFTKTLK